MKASRTYVGTGAITTTEHIDIALYHLKQARFRMRMIGARRAALAIARALKSAEGARRHNVRKISAARRKLGIDGPVDGGQ